MRIYNVALTQAQIAKDMATPLATSNPPQFVAGDQAIESQVDSNPQGMSQAFQATAQKGGIMTAVQVYLDTGSTATAVVAGIYRDSNSHPGTLVAQGTLTTLNAGAWNSIPVPPAAIANGTKYWVAVLGSKGIMKFRDKLGMGSGLVETSASSTLTSLPSTWNTGAVYTTEGPMSAYAVGY